MIRVLKQFIYGGFYLAVLVFIAFLVYSATFKAEPAEVLSQNLPIPEIPEPTLVFENLRTEVDEAEVKVTGVLKNESPQVVPRVTIKAVIFNEEGIEIFISETLKEEIRAFEARSFTVFFPKDQGLAGQVKKESTKVSYVLQ